ncbi:helix-turn-helix domain-containing protein [Actinomadura keratinilytica]
MRQRSVTEVSGRAGYASPAAFTAAFTRSFGMPPSRFAGPANRS